MIAKENSRRLSELQMEKLRTAMKSQVNGEWIFKLSNLERILYLAGQNLSKSTINEIRELLVKNDETNDEIFLDDLEPILASFWEELTDEEIEKLLLESFEMFDVERQGSIDRIQLTEILTKLGEMPMSKEDLRLVFSLVDSSKTSSSSHFNYRDFVRILIDLDQPRTRSTKKKNAKKKKV